MLHGVYLVDGAESDLQIELKVGTCLQWSGHMVCAWTGLQEEKAVQRVSGTGFHAIWEVDIIHGSVYNIYGYTESTCPPLSLDRALLFGETIWGVYIYTVPNRKLNPAEVRHS